MKFRSFFINLSLLILSFIFMFLIFEAIFRYINLNQDTQNSLSGNKEFCFDCYEDFFRNYKEYSQDKVLRILLIGDSVIEAGCPNAYNLEKEFNNRLRNLTYYGKDITFINVIDGGRGGDHTNYILQRLRWYLNYTHIDMISVLAGWNDHWYNYDINPCETNECYYGREFAHEIKDHESANCEFCNFISESTYNALLQSNRKICAESFTKNPGKFLSNLNHSNTTIYRVPLQNFSDNLVEIIKIAENNDKKISFITPPNALVPGKLSKMIILDCVFLEKNMLLPIHNLYIEKMRQIARKNNISVVDLDNEFNKIEDKEPYFSDIEFDPVHVNTREGNKLCNKIYFDNIIEQFRNDPLISFELV
ncbi:hypothetical protein GF327_04275 [Candidatus Woesearchaeota archaeon]|nr:hypothetical protein [Candidatus Woesearchaeota archaeon]